MDTSEVKILIIIDIVSQKNPNTIKNMKFYVKNYRQVHKMDYMLFACVLKEYFGN